MIGDGREAMEPQTSPPPWSFFAGARPALGEAAFDLVLGPLTLGLSGLEASLCRRLVERFRPYAREPGAAGSHALRIEALDAQRDHFIPPPKHAAPNRVLLECDGDRVRYAGHRVAGWFDTAAGRGQLLLGHGSYERAEGAVENYVRAAVAWQAAARGGALVHAASAVRGGRGYLFYGQSGAGKSTLAGCNRRGRIVSDDLSLVLPGAEGPPELIGSPFRGTYEEGDPVVGAFPLAAGFRLVQDRCAAVKPVARARALAELVGNLPFVAEWFSRRPELFERLQRGFSDLPLAHLHFRKDDSFWDAIDAAGL